MNRMFGTQNGFLKVKYSAFKDIHNEICASRDCITTATKKKKTAMYLQQ